MTYQRTLELSAGQRQTLQHYRDHDQRPYVRERCAAILKIADGKAPHWVAQHGLLKPRDPDTVYAWLNRYETMGFVGLLVRQHGGPRRRGL
jgi:hypothetical protein